MHIHRMLFVGLLAVLAPAGMASAQLSVAVRDATNDGRDDLVTRSALYEATLEPARGGNLTGFVFAGQEFARREGVAADGLFKVMLMPYHWRGDFHDRPFDYQLVEQTAQRCVVAFHRTGTVDDLKFVDLQKTYTFEAGRPQVTVEVTVAVQQRAQVPLRLGLILHHNVSGAGLNLRFVQPTAEGVTSVEARGREGGVWNREPPRGWSGFVDAEKALGGVFVGDAPTLATGLNWLAARGDTGSAELHYVSMPIPQGEKWSTRVSFLPFKGLTRIDGAGAPILRQDGARNPPPAGAGGVVVGSLEPAADGGRATVALVCGEDSALRLQAHVMDPDHPERNPQALPPAEVAAKAGTVVSREIPLPAGASGVLVCDVMAGAERLARLERAIGARAGKPYAMAALEKRYVPPKEEFHAPPLSADLVTPHRAWAKPWAGSTLPVFFLMALDQQRQVVELAQRYDIAFDRVPLGGPALFDFTHVYRPQGQRALPEKEAADLLIEALRKPAAALAIGDNYSAKYKRSDLPWNRLPEEARRQILRKVREGCGLVYYNPAGLDKEAEEAFLGRPAPADHYVLSWTDPALLFPKGAEQVLVKEYGAGRIVVIREPHLGIQPYRAAFEHTPRQMEEYHYALAARALLWVSRREPELRLTPGRPSAAGHEVALSRPASAEVGWELVDELASVVDRGTVTLQAGKGVIPMRRPERGGTYYLHQFLRQGGLTHDWRVDLLPVQAPARILEAEVEPPGKGGAALRLKVANPGRQALQALLQVRSQAGDLYATARQALPAEEARLPIPTEEVPGVGARLLVEVRDGERTLDRRDLLLPLPGNVRRLRERFFSLVWGDHAWTTDHASALVGQRALRRIGFTGALHSMSNLNTTNYGIVRSQVDAGLAPVIINLRRHVVTDPNIVFNYQQTHDKKLLWRNPCLSSPETRQDLERILQRVVDEGRRYGFLAHYWGDECSFTYEGGHRPLDICFHPDTLRDFRVWLKGRTTDLAALNAEWGTAFASWEAVEPKTLDEVQGTGRLGPWLEHRLFSDHQYCTLTLKEYSDRIRQQDPGALVGESGIQAEVLAYGGFNWPLKMGALNFITPYGEPYVLTQLAPWYPEASRSARWIGYNRAPVPTQYDVWHDLFFGARSLSYWYYRHLVGADLRPTEEGVRVQALLKELHSGTGDLLARGQRQFDRVGILYSQASAVGACALTDTGADTYQLYRDNLQGWLKAFLEAGLQPVLIPEERLEQADVRVLVLPMALSLSEETARRLRRYVEGGGWLIADVLPGVLTEHGRLLPAGRLDDLFGVRRSGPPRLGAGVALDINAPGLGAGAATLSGVALESGIAAEKAVPRASAQSQVTRVGSLAFSRKGSGGGAWFASAAGRGRTLYLGALPAGWRDRSGRHVLRSLCVAAGASPDTALQGADGSDIAGALVNRFRLGALALVGVTVPPERIENASVERLALADLPRHTLPARLRLSEERHFYDVRKKAYLGHGRQVPLTLTIGTGNLVAAVPYKIGRVALEAGTLRGAPGSTVVLLGRIEGCPQYQGFVHCAVVTGNEERDALLSGLAEVAGGRFDFRVRVPLDASGTWQVRVTEAVTGQQAAAVIRMEGR